MTGVVAEVLAAVVVLPEAAVVVPVVAVEVLLAQRVARRSSS